jgi:hypothetical protein
MRCYPKPHKFYGGLDVHARTMYLCILNQEGEIVLHRQMKAAPEPVRKAIAPDREDLVVAVAWTLDLVLARRPLRPGTDALWPRPRPLSASDPRR